MSFAGRFTILNKYHARGHRRDVVHHQDRRERFEREYRSMVEETVGRRGHFGRREDTPKTKHAEDRYYGERRPLKHIAG